MKGFPFFKPLLPALVLLGVGCGGDSTDDRTPAGDQLALSSVTIGGQSGLSDFDDVSPDAEIVLDFTAALDAATVEANIYLLDAGGAKVDASDVYDGAKRVTLKPSAGLNAYASYRLIVDSGLKSAAGEAILTGKVIRIRTGLDTSDKFPQISDEELLTKVQQQTFPLFLGGCRTDERHGARAHLVGRDGHYRRDGIRRDGHGGGRRARFRDPQRGVPAGAADRDLPCGAGDLLSRRLLALDRRPDGADASLLGR